MRAADVNPPPAKLGGSLALPDVLPELVALLAALGAALYVSRGVHGGFPLDDAWIHMVYGSSFATSGTLSYNPGAPSTGCTSLLWAALTGGIHLAAGGPAHAAMGVKVLGLVCHALTAALAARLARRSVGKRRHAVPAALAAGLLTALNPTLAFAATSGMEVSLTALLLVSAFVASSASRWTLAACALSTAVLARPESVLALVPVALVAATSSPARLRALSVVLGLGLLGPVGFVLRNRWVSGRFLPATYYGKAELGRPVGKALSAGLGDTLLGLAPGSWLVLGLAGLALLLGSSSAPRAWKDKPERWVSRHVLVAAAALTASVWVVGESLLVNMQLPKLFYYQRYLAPPLPLFVVSAVCGGAWLVQALSRSVAAARGSELAAGVATGVVLALALLALPGRRATYARDVASIDAAQVQIGRVIAETTAPEAVVWTVDAGAIRYFGRRPTLDLMGLNTPELIHDGKVNKAWWPDSVVIVPRLFQVHAPPGLVELVLIAQRPDDPLPPARSLDAKALFRCQARYEGERENKIAVSALGNVIAVGRCMRR